MFKRLFAAIAAVILAASAALAADGTVTGTIRTPSSAVPISNGTLTFTLNQAGVVAGGAALSTTPVTCATSVDGSVVLLKNPTVAPTVTPNTSAGSLGAGTYYVKFTYYDGSTQSLPSPVRSAVLSATGKLIVTAPASTQSADGYKVYIGTTQGSETLQATVAGFASNYEQTTSLAAGAALPTTNNTVCALTFNDSIIPTSTKYRVNLTNAAGAQIPGYPQNVYLTGTTVNVSNGWPLATDVETRYYSPIISSPASNATQSINSPLTLNDYALTAGQIVLPDTASPPAPQAGTAYMYNDGGVLYLVANSVNIAPTVINSVRNCHTFSGADMGAKIANCIGDLPSTGGTADARGFEGAQVISSNIFSGVTKPVNLLLGAGTTTVTENITAPANVTVVFGNGSIWSVSVSKTATFNGHIAATLSNHFSGSGAVSLPRHREVYLEWFGGVADDSTDNAAAFAAAYSALPGDGGIIRLLQGVYRTATAISFATADKHVTIMGSPSGGSSVRYTGTTGTLFTFNNGDGSATVGCCQQGSGIRDVNLIGPGDATSTIAVTFGGSNGLIGFAMSKFKIEEFGLGIQRENGTWHARFEHGLLRNNNRHVNLRSTDNTTGTDMVFDTVEMQESTERLNGFISYGNGLVYLLNCNLGVQLVIDGAAGNAPQVHAVNTSFNNEFTPAVTLTAIHVKKGQLRIFGGSYQNFIASPNQPTEVMKIDNDARVEIFGFNTFSNWAMTNFVVLSGSSQLFLYNLNDLGGNISSLIGGSSTGYVLSMAGANQGGSTPFDYTVGTVAGADTTFRVKGDIQVTKRLLSTVATGTAPISVDSTTPVANLNANAVAYNSSGTQQPNSKFAFGMNALSGGTVTITLSGSAVYTSSSSYRCVATDEAAINAVRVTNVSASQFTITGTGTDNVNWICIGN